MIKAVKMNLDILQLLLIIIIIDYFCKALFINKNLIAAPVADANVHLLRSTFRWSTWPAGSAAAQLWCRAPRAPCVDPWAWWRWHTRCRRPRSTKCAWRATCLSSEWTWTCKSFIVRTGTTCRLKKKTGLHYSFCCCSILGSAFLLKLIYCCWSELAKQGRVKLLWWTEQEQMDGGFLCSNFT